MAYFNIDCFYIATNRWSDPKLVLQKIFNLELLSLVLRAQFMIINISNGSLRERVNSIFIQIFKSIFDIRVKFCTDWWYKLVGGNI